MLTDIDFNTSVLQKSNDENDLALRWKEMLENNHKRGHG